MRLISRLIVCTLWLCYSLHAGDDPSGPYTLNDLLESARINNPSIKAERKNYARAQDSNTSTQRNRLPSLSMSSSLRNSESSASDSRSGSLGLNLTQPLYNGGRLSAQKTSSQLTLNNAKLNLKRSLQRLDRDIIQAWYDLLLFQSIAREEKEALSRLKQHKHNVSHFFKQGKVWRNDLLQAGVRVARGKKSLIEAEHDVLNGKAQINQLLGRDIDSPLKITGALKYQDILWDWESVKNLSLKDHPEHEVAKNAVIIARQNVKTASAASNFQVNLSGSYNHARSWDPSSSNTDSVALSISASKLLWDFKRTSYNKRAAKHAMDAAKHRVEDSKQNIQLAAKRAWFQVRESSENVNVLEKALVHAKENYRVNQVRYQEQLGTSNDLLDAEDLMKDTRLDWLRAIKDYWIAIANLEFQLGVDPKFLISESPITTKKQRNKKKTNKPFTMMADDLLPRKNKKPFSMKPQH